MLPRDMDPKKSHGTITEGYKLMIEIEKKTLLDQTTNYIV